MVIWWALVIVSVGWLGADPRDYHAHTRDVGAYPSREACDTARVAVQSGLPSGEVAFCVPYDVGSK